MIGPAQIAPGVHGLGSEYVNWYLVEEQGRLTAVDGGVPGFGKRLEADLEQIGHSIGDVEAIVLTHADADHTGLAPKLKQAGARVLVHADDDGLLRKPGPKGGDASLKKVLPNLRRTAVLKLEFDIIRNGGAKPAKVEGAELYSDGDVLDVPGRPRAIHTPGHTRGHCVLHFEGVRALFVGDALLTHELFTEGTGPQLMPKYLNIDYAQALRSLDLFEHVEADVMLVGHGAPWRGGVATAVGNARAVAGG